MLSQIPQAANHSTVVQMDFTLDSGDCIAVGQLGDEFLIFETPINLPPCHGEMMLSVDGKERRWKVSVPEGASETVAKTRIAAMPMPG